MAETVASEPAFGPRSPAGANTVPASHRFRRRVVLVLGFAGVVADSLERLLGDSNDDDDDREPDDRVADLEAERDDDGAGDDPRG